MGNGVYLSRSQSSSEDATARKKFTISGYGSEKLSLKHTYDIVLRKSAFTCTRTVGINAENAAIDVPREMISKLRNPNVKGLFRIIIGETE